MSICEEISIYEELKEFYKKNNGQIYTFQDLDISGEREYQIITKKINVLNNYEKSDFAKELVDSLVNLANNKIELKKLNEFINLNPIILYYESYIKYLKSYIKDNYKLKDKIKFLMEKLIKKSSCVEEVKLGIISSFLFEFKDIYEMLNIFSVHNNYIFYVIKTFEFLDDNDAIFKLAKKSYGYGKVFCIMNLNSVNKEIRKWLIEDGLDNNVGILELLEYTFLSKDILVYFKENDYDKEKFEILVMYFSKYLISEYEISELNNGIELCTHIINCVKEHSGGIYSLYSIILIMNSIENSMCYEEDDEKEIDSAYNDMFLKCKEICNQKNLA
eukprot:TRINITY_DN5706_c0_g1_i2.p2 TRINITY_DN5706_c0_g1~~TRINITY_DN5706_c0_g1_i2.p2  ORF type:complete len:331 (-),score=64.70 TRINITY_DN5706_c0_g1_i2:637-1629(-)